MRQQPAETTGTPTQTSHVRALTNGDIVGRILAILRQRRRRRPTSLDTPEPQSRPIHQGHGGKRFHDERVGPIKRQAVLDRALQLPESLRLGFLLRELYRETRGHE